MTKVEAEAIQFLENQFKKWVEQNCENIFIILDKKEDLLPFIKSKPLELNGNEGGRDFVNFIKLLDKDLSLPNNLSYIKQKRKEIITAWPFLKEKENLFSKIFASESPDFIATDMKSQKIGIEVIDWSHVQNEEGGTKANIANSASSSFTNELFKSKSVDSYTQEFHTYSRVSDSVYIDEKSYPKRKIVNSKPLMKHFLKTEKYIKENNLDELIFVIKIQEDINEAEIKLWIRMIKENFQECCNEIDTFNTPIKAYVWTWKTISIHEHKFYKEEFLLNK